MIYDNLLGRFGLTITAPFGHGRFMHNQRQNRHPETTDAINLAVEFPPITKPMTNAPVWSMLAGLMRHPASG